MVEEVLKLSDYGLIGAMLGGFFVMWHRAVGLAREAFAKIHDDGIRERKEWRESIEKGQDRVAGSLEKLSDELRELSRRS